jgi:hypothetical protein
MKKKKIKKLKKAVKKKVSKKSAKKKAKKVIKKKAKKIAKKKIGKNPPAGLFGRGGTKAKKTVKSEPKRKPIGEVTHFYDKICVAVIRFDQGVAVGEEVCLEGPKGSFSQVLGSMQYEHQAIQKAEKGQEVGVKVKKEVKEGHKVYRA